MLFHVKNLGLIDEAEIKLDGITVAMLERELEISFLGLLILIDICKSGISETRKKANFILVYSDEKEQIIDVIEERASPVDDKFKLKKYEDLYYQQILILTAKEFQEKFVDLWEADAGLKNVGEMIL